MSKRPPIDLMALTTLTTDEAAPMAEATQRSTSSEKPGREGVSKDKPIEPVRTENLSPLNFKVPPAFRQRYRLCALKAGLKLNELLFEALDAWETKQRR
jgi:hypothetical protein